MLGFLPLRQGRLGFTGWRLRELLPMARLQVRPLRLVRPV
jgi:hypothetical protein